VRLEQALNAHRLRVRGTVIGHLAPDVMRGKVESGPRGGRYTATGARPGVTNPSGVPDDIEARPWMGPRAVALERRLERPMLLAAALVIPALILEGTEHGTYRSIAQVLNWVIWLAFTGELIAMLIVVRSRGGWLQHNVITVAIVVLTPPFLPGIVQGVRAVRLLQLARLLRLAPIFKLVFSLRGLRYATFFTLLVVVTGAAAFESTQSQYTYFDSIYWAVGTMTTVGSGNVVPTTNAAKLLAMALMVVGVGYFAVITGSIAQRFVAYGEDERVEEATADSAGEDLHAQVERIALRAQELSDHIEALRSLITAERSRESA
jgi:voltage-gated potassium channel